MSASQKVDNYSQVSGNLLTANEEYIVQQCCCTAVRPHGLSASIAGCWPKANVYAHRRALGQRNMAVPADRPTPGTLVVINQEQRPVICLFAQVAMGKPGRSDNGGVADSAVDRVQYFQQCLTALSALEARSLAFPYGIGCGLAGGDWQVYEELLRQWAREHPQTKVTLYRL